MKKLSLIAVLLLTACADDPAVNGAIGGAIIGGALGAVVGSEGRGGEYRGEQGGYRPAPVERRDGGDRGAYRGEGEHRGRGEGEGGDYRGEGGDRGERD